MQTLFRKLRAELKRQADPVTKAGCERYFRSVIRFYGVKTPQINALYRLFASEIKSLALEESLELVERLLASPFAEEKGLAIRILHSRHRQLDAMFLTRFEPIFREHVYDWATADGLSGKVLRFLIERDAKFAKRIVAWRDDDCMWLQRMAAVSFVNLARHGTVTTEVLQVCSTTIRSEERFVQLGTGWVLRELWLAEPAKVESFISKNYVCFSREGLRYAIEKMPKRQQKIFLVRPC